MKAGGPDGCGSDVCGLKYISHRNRFIYFEVPKTGTGSLLNLLAEHAAATRMEGRFDFLEYPDYLKFAFVRNPWDRFLSCYLSKIKKDGNFENKNFKNGVMKKFHRFDVFYAGMPFDEFLRAVGSIPDEIADGHFGSQHPRLVMDGEIVVDHLARFEDYRDEINNLLRGLGLNVGTELPHLNESDRSMPYAAYYNDETIRLVEERFTEDIRLFGYQFDEALAGNQ